MGKYPSEEAEGCVNYFRRVLISMKRTGGVFKRDIGMVGHIRFGRQMFLVPKDSGAEYQVHFAHYY